ncbi:MAG TPA: GNAT family N-acetyltransferase [Burkholderiaceae bacterium]|nr:GNAT family N-acetyltransferase [Burkholderiaceae bacterium]
MPTACTIRPARSADAAAIRAIVNDVIATSTAIYSFEPTSLEERSAWLAARAAAGLPVLVAEREGTVLGFSSFGEFRGAWPGYRYSVEHSVHVRADCRGQGIGPLLVAALFPHAAALGKHVMIGGIDAGNAASLRMHAHLGFEQVAHFREVGHKFGRWLDLVFVQRFLDAPGSARAEPLP